ncbi:5-formyltetrahydrofolate cyclo-ligase, partial [Frankia sp. Cpl3]|nr:5-formyltetrahydrofolate cyclo-ligase [Frankia sp. Cpl3]
VYTGEENLRQGVWGIFEPDPDVSQRAEREKLEAIVVPGVAFARDGGRLGYGGGYYDRFLATLERKPLLIGFAFSCQVIDQVPLEKHDYPLDYL